MEQPNNIDQQFRDRLQGAEVPPPAFVWPNVERALQQRRRRLFFWLWFGLGLTVAGGWALWAGRHSAAPVGTMPIAAAPKTETKRITGVGATAGRDEDYSRVSPARANTPSPVNQPQHSASRASTKGIFANGKNFKQSSVTTDLPAQSAIFSNTLIPDAAPSVTTQPADISLLSASTAFQPLPAGEYALLNKPMPVLLLPPAKIKKRAATNKNCYDFAPHAKVWLFDAYVGPSLPKRELNATRPDYENYLGHRRTTEQADWAFHAGLRGSLLLGRHFLLRSGLHYEQMTEVFEYADPDYIQVTIRQTTKIIDNVPVTVIDTIGIDYGEHYVKTYNRYGRLDVPLLAGVEFRKGRAGLSLQAGASLNVYFWKRGTVLDAQLQPQSFTPDDATGKSPVFRQRAGWSTTASAQVFYHLRPRLRVFAEPYGSHNLRPLTLDGQPISQRYTTWGLKLGLTKILD